MKRLIKCIPFVVFLFCVSTVYAQNVRSTFGNKDSSGEYTITERTDNIVYMRPSGGFKFSYQSVTTSDTLTAVESGKTFVYSGTINSVFTLPVAAVGMRYTFVASDGDSTFAVDPNGTDLIKWSATLLSLDPGDRLVSPGTTKDTLELFCAVANEWAVGNIEGTFTDGGQ